jgi:hypothetical protein
VAAHLTCLPAPLAASAGDIDGAVEGLADAIPHLVLGSLNESTFQLVRRRSGSSGTHLCGGSGRQDSTSQPASQPASEAPQRRTAPAARATAPHMGLPSNRARTGLTSLI